MLGSLKGLSCASCAHKDCDGSKGISDYTFDGEVIAYCPLTVATREIMRYLSLYTHYKNGYLPAGGGALDQPARYLKMMEIIQATVSEYEEEEAQKRKRRGNY